MDMSKSDALELSRRERAALREENAGLREWRRTRIEWRALQALIDAVATPAAA
jgi:hypothetical protein